MKAIQTIVVLLLFLTATVCHAQYSGSCGSGDGVSQLPNSTLGGIPVLIYDGGCGSGDAVAQLLNSPLGAADILVYFGGCGSGDGVAQLLNSPLRTVDVLVYIGGCGSGDGVAQLLNSPLGAKDVLVYSGGCGSGDAVGQLLNSPLRKADVLVYSGGCASGDGVAQLLNSPLGVADVLVYSGGCGSGDGMSQLLNSPLKAADVLVYSGSCGSGDAVAQLLNSPLGGCQTVITIGGNLSFCSGSSTTLSTSPFNTGLLWSTGATTQSVIVNTAGTFTVTATYTYGCTATASAVVTINCAIAFALKMFIQGYYQGGGLMQPVLFNEGIDPNPASVKVDTIRVSLVDSVLLAHDPNDNSTDADTVATAKGVLQTNGSLAVTFPGSVAGHNYYLMVTHRNAVQTWSAKTVSITNGGLYDFTTTANKAYGNNMVSLGDGNYAFYSGDLNQDGGIDGFDFLILDPDIISGNGGYLLTDINGDGGVDGFDFLVLDPNIISGIGTAHP